MNRYVKKYCRKIGWQLTCRRQTRQQLIQGLSEELEETNLPSYEELLRQYGSPAEMAAQLQETVPPDEAHKARCTARTRLILLIAAVLLLFGALSAWYIHYRNQKDPLYCSTIIIEGDQEIPEFEDVVWIDGD